MHLSLTSWAWIPLLIPVAQATSILLERGNVITFDEETLSPLVLRNASILIIDDTISAIFHPSRNDSVAVPDDVERIPADNDIISPGFVDTHRHVWQTVLRGLGADSTISEYLFRWANPQLSAESFDPEIMYYSQLMGLCEAQNSGVTTIVDNGSNTFSEVIAEAERDASIDSGIRTFWAYHIGNVYANFSVEDQIAVYRRFTADPRVQESLLSMGIGYEGFATLGANVTNTVLNLARDLNASVVETHYDGGNLGSYNSPALLQQLNFLNQSFPVIFVHSNRLTPRDIAVLRSYDHYTSFVPEFELHHGNDNYLPSLAQDRGSLSVGTHYSSSGDIVTQARMWLQTVRGWRLSSVMQEFKVPANNPMSVNQAFLLATRSGGLALGRPDLGVLRVGAKADIAVFDGTAPGMLGWQNAIAAVILHSNVGNVKHVLVDGQWRKRDGELLCAVNQTDVESRFLEAARRVQSFWEGVPPTVLEGVSPLAGSEYAILDEVDVTRRFDVDS
ncbi:putative amidohydrolase family protein [Colletotrichum karsti]|uniref:Amidohydrolase family protein n=1 Tax=Colletotrichum karsti TaxID=1095194 RepID=A0A9P6LDR7_9PEZI|nr:putative amidohydrolase family protein [Colletotrichum karsti]KAF9872234.1 putative amidohydrolase family protein [Colletotrichum karsti]